MSRLFSSATVLLQFLALKQNKKKSNINLKSETDFFTFAKVKTFFQILKAVFWFLMSVGSTSLFYSNMAAASQQTRCMMKHVYRMDRDQSNSGFTHIADDTNTGDICFCLKPLTVPRSLFGPSDTCSAVTELQMKHTSRQAAEDVDWWIIRLKRGWAFLL